VHLVDVSHPDFEAQIDAVQKILLDLGHDRIPTLLVFNKVDLLDESSLAERMSGRDALPVSSLRVRGVDRLLERIDFALPKKSGMTPIS